MLKIELKDGKARIEASGSLGEIIGEFANATREIKQSIEENDKEAGFIFTCAVSGALLGIDEDEVIKSIKEAVKEKFDKKDSEGSKGPDGSEDSEDSKDPEN